jgi:RNA polymerase-binding transcription factor DksA
MDEYRALHQQLMACLAQLEHRLYKLETGRQRATKPLFDTDCAAQAAVLQNDAVVDKLVEEARRQVVAIRVALTRIAQNIYRICRTCEEPIAPRRLAALPYTSQCLACAIQAEQEARHSR